MTDPTRYDRNRPARHRGFTLLEVMAALTIFMVGVVGVLALFATGLALHQDATERTIVGLASDEVRGEVLASLEGLIDGQSTLPVFRDVAVKGRRGYYFDADLMIDPDEGLEGGVMAKVFVYTLDAGQKRGEKFTLFVSPGQSPETLIRKARGEKIKSPQPTTDGSSG